MGALDTIRSEFPSVTDFDRDPLELIETGDWVIVDGDRAVVEVHKRVSGRSEQ